MVRFFSIGSVSRWWICVTVLASVAAGCCHGNASSGDKISVTVIDVHTHVFNARDLPLKGILNSMGVPMGVASTLAKILDWWTPDDDGDRVLDISSIKRPTDDVRRLAAIIRGKVTSSRRALTTGSLFPPMTEAERSQLLSYAGVARPQALPTMNDSDQFEVNVVAKALGRAQFPPSCRKLPPFLARLRAADIGGNLRFLSIITESHRGIAAQLSRTEYPEVGLFVHHMMDLARTYNDVPAVPFDVQSGRMSALDASFHGKLLHFVAYDPFRRGDALDYVKRGIAAGAVGVKFYPPSGYSAACNVIPPTPTDDKDAIARWQSRYGGSAPLSATDIDAMNDSLFQYCEANDIPILAHCTPGGFEAASCYGLMSDPKYWACALKKHQGLRLCLAHAGGDAFWFAAIPAMAPPTTTSSSTTDSFGREVVCLCLQYANVYCDTGYLEMISDSRSRQSLRLRLEQTMNQKSTKGDWHFGNKLMYGSDWYMLSREQNSEAYLNEFWEVFSTPELQAWQRAFFAGNAVDFLNLTQLAEKPDLRFTDGQRAYWKKIVAAAKHS